MVIDLAQSPLRFGGAISPAVVPCGFGSGCISPFFPNLYHSFGGTKSAFETWHDGTFGGTETFRMWGNGDPIALNDEQAVSVQPHVGRWDAGTYHGTLVPRTIHEFPLKFALPLIPTTSIPFNDLGQQDYDDYVKTAGATGGENRCYYDPALRHALYHTDPVKKQAGFDALLSWCKTRVERRAYFHLSKNANQGGSVVFIKPKVGSLGEINDTVLDDLGNPRRWSALTKTIDGWEAWDKGHNNHQNAFCTALAGHPIGAVAFWNIWRWYTQCFNPNHQKNNGYAFDQPRSASWAILMAIDAYLLGFEWADPQMIKFHVGGNANGDGTGQNGSAGWKPSQVMETMAKRLAELESANPPPPGWFVDSGGCDDNAITCLCDCAAAPPPSSGDSGCEKDGLGNNTGNWIGPDGVNYGSQVRGVLVWQGAMCMFASYMLIRFHDYIVSIWPNKQPLTQPTYDALKAKLANYTQQCIDRFFDTSWRGMFYSGVRGTSYKTPEPAGYPQTVADAMLADAVFCNPGKAGSLGTKQVQNRTDEWIVGDKLRQRADEYYALIVPPFAFALGAFHPSVETILDELLPPPGQESGGGGYDDYSNAARYADIVYALRESGTNNVVISSPLLKFGLQAAANSSKNVVIDLAGTPMAFGLETFGNDGTKILILGGKVPVKFGMRMDGQFGQNSVNQAFPLGFGLEADFDAAGLPHFVVINAPVMAWGLKTSTSPVSIVRVPIDIGESPMAFGLFASSGLKNGTSVLVNTSPIRFGLRAELQTTVTLSVEPLQIGMGMSATVAIKSSAVIFKPVLAFGLAARKGTVKKTYKNKYTASGPKFTLEK